MKFNASKEWLEKMAKADDGGNVNIGSLPSEMMIPDPYLGAHEKSFRSRKQLEASRWVGCFYCVTIFPPSSIREWIDHEETALCPYCRIDSVLPITKDQFDSDFLQEMNRHWFSPIEMHVYGLKA